MESRFALLVGLDGVRSDVIRAELAEGGLGDGPFARALEKGATAFSLYSGGRFTDKSRTPLDCGPSWASLLSGVWADQHKVYLNEHLGGGRFNESVPTLFNYARGLFPGDSTAAVLAWEPLRHIAQLGFKGPCADIIQCGKARSGDALETWIEEDVMCARMALGLLSMPRAPRLLFLQLGSVEAGGRALGFSASSEDYVKTLRCLVPALDRLLAGVEKRRACGEEWLTVLASEHGGQGLSHTEQIWQNRLAWALLHNPADKTLSGPIPAVQGIISITPTIIAFLAGKWEDDKYPFISVDPIGKAPLRNLCLRFEPVEGRGYHPEGVRLTDGYPLPLSLVFLTLSGIQQEITATLFTQDILFVFLADKTYRRCHGEDVTTHSIVEDFELMEKQPSSCRVIGVIPYPDEGCSVFLSNGTFITYTNLPDAEDETVARFSGQYEFKSILGLKSLRNIRMVLPRFESDAKATFVLRDTETKELTSISVEVDEKEFGHPRPFDFSRIFRGLEAFDAHVSSAVVSRYDDNDDMILFLNRIPYD